MSPSLSASEKPMMAFKGVRSSCDMVAKNSDFMCEACSSSTFFSCKERSKRLISATSRNTSTAPTTWPLRSRMGEQLSAIAHSVPSRATKMVSLAKACKVP